MNDSTSHELLAACTSNTITVSSCDVCYTRSRSRVEASATGIKIESSDQRPFLAPSLSNNDTGSIFR